MKKLYKDRLETLATHLESGKLFHDEFDFSIFHCAPTNCGSAGCALGECPFLFPEHWFFTGAGARPRIKGSYQIGDKIVDNPGAFDAASIYFGIHSNVALHLFAPFSQAPKFFGGNKLYPDSSREDVAENIRDYIRLSETLLGKVRILLGKVFG